MKTSDFDYHLPDELIAQLPLGDRAASRMLVVNRATGEIRHDQFRSFPTYIRAGDLLVLNDTKVIPARIWSQKPNVELLLVEHLGSNRWSALVKPGHRAKVGRNLFFTPWLSAAIEGETDFGGRILQFTGDVDSYLQHHGAPPLPPYIRRPVQSGSRLSAATGRGAEAPPRLSDRERYQTVFAQTPGAIAAPTAGLHFTPEMLATLPHAFITLHVGIGTFRPVKVENVEDHKMHAEKFTVSGETVAAIRAAQRIVAIGTTVARTLETIAPSLQHSNASLSGSTDIFIHPPFPFRVVGALLTNFHLPKSTLLMLVSAFAGRELVLKAYAEAVRERYRFFSYGDCMLLV
ncbi:MAG: tRNA preQ1(34) S-adenosylmethionine ribosyltransferase-isomerase QueA [Verrucomicrobia bacterium]|nr:tRNA preQ1(34) S-adenosylmethionine ribosyltransferase-isomerase QueA [Verrucomicrobiota bacterium]